VETKRNIRIDVNLNEFTDSVARVIPIFVENSDYQKRINARNYLVHMGKRILSQMNILLTSKNISLRKEAAKIIKMIGDKESIPVLINLLDDDDSGIRWIAADGLVNIGRDTIVPLLETITKNTDTYYVRLGAYHVFTRLFTRREKMDFRTLLLSLKNYTNIAIMAPIEAFKALIVFRHLNDIVRKYFWD
jgi:hypothetical protein